MSPFGARASLAALLSTLAATSALAQGAPATTISTSNFNARIGGFMTAGIGYVDTDAHDAEVEIVNDAEVIFTFSLAADNGITFGAKVEFEANGTSENADEYVAHAEGAFGRIEIGREDGASDRIGRVAGETSFTGAATETGLLFDYASDETPAGLPESGADTGDELKITYFTPRFAGLQGGLSYVPGNDSSGGSRDPREFNQGGTSTNGADDSDEAIEAGLTYRGEFGDFGVRAGVGATFFLDEDQKELQDSYTAILNGSFAGFSAGVGYSITDPKPGENIETVRVGASFETGPWLFGAQYAQNLDGDGADGPGLFGANEDDMGLSLGVDYALAPGVTVGAVAEYAAADEVPAGEDDDALAAGLFLGLTF
jgi:predicted porin